MNQRTRTERSILRNRRRGTEITPAPVLAKVADLDIYKAEQVDKARELISDGGLQPINGVIFLAVSSRGDAWYSATETACTCPAGSRGVRCYHTAAVRIALAA